MSDLLPLVAAALRDKVVNDANDELINVKRELAQMRAVDVVRQVGDGQQQVVATAQMDHGKWGVNPKFWEISFQQLAVCKLSELLDVKIYNGGGFPLHSLQEAGDFDDMFEFWGYFHPDKDGDTSTSKTVYFRLSSLLDNWLKIVVHGWPQESWINHCPTTRDAPRHLVGSIARQFPHATVEYKTMLLSTEENERAIQRLVPPHVQHTKYRQSVAASAANRAKGCKEASTYLVEFVAAQMKTFRCHNPFSTPNMQRMELMELLRDNDIHDHTENNENELLAIIKKFKKDRQC